MEPQSSGFYSPTSAAIPRGYRPSGWLPRWDCKIPYFSAPWQYCSISKCIFNPPPRAAIHFENLEKWAADWSNGRWKLRKLGLRFGESSVSLDDGDLSYINVLLDASFRKLEQSSGKWDVTCTSRINLPPRRRVKNGNCAIASKTLSAKTLRVDFHDLCPFDSDFKRVA